jgi:y4mF family transcriptional regulator
MIPSGNKNSNVLNSPAQLGEVVRQQRKRQGLTQKELAGLTGVGVRFLSELEPDKESCELGKALLVVKMLGISLLVNAADYD